MAGSEFPFEDGYIITAEGQNNAHNNIGKKGLINSGVNLVRQLQDRNVTLVKGEFAEAYTSAGGRKSTVDTNETTAVFSSASYFTDFTPQADSDTTHDPDSVNNPNNAFDFDDETRADKVWSTGDSARTAALGKTFSEKFIGLVRIKASGYLTRSDSSGSTANYHIRLQSYNGTDWVTESTLTSGNHNRTSFSWNGTYTLNKNVQGIRIEILTYRSTYWSESAYARFYIIDYGDSETWEIHHTIPSGTFSQNINKTIGIPVIVDTEDTADIQYKLTADGGNEDTGWLNNNELNYFTDFTQEPDKLIVKLIPSQSLTPAIPAISGFTVYELGD